ncbi:MAG: PHP domain-containing protein [Candidatus Glassbacteria bacterium]|nr:PHP domain-containing protein [Candidatus Glassbacteria bacterium]
MAEFINECDLHVHTTASDGGWSPEEVVRLAAGRGVRTIAITDHDSTASNARAEAAGAQFGVEVIPGVELTTSEGNHILGYFIASGAGELADYLTALRNRSLTYMRGVVEEMHRTRGLQVTADELEQCTGGGIPNMSHLLDLLCRRGQLPDSRFDSPEAVEFFGDSDYLVNYFRTFARTKPFADTPGAIRMIRRAGGAAVWAHPAYSRRIDIEYIDSLREIGLTGLEVDTPKHDQPTRARLLEICKERGLVPTGGTDYHGRYFESIERGRGIGNCGTEPENVERLREAAETLRRTG